MDDAGNDAAGEPWRCATTGEAIQDQIYRLRHGVADRVVGARWALDLSAGDGEWSTMSPLGSRAARQWEPTPDELLVELGEWMPEDYALRLLNVFRDGFPEVLPVN